MNYQYFAIAMECLCVVLFLICIDLHKKLRRAQGVKEKVDPEEQRLIEIEKELFRLKNPPKYESGDIVGDILICSHKIAYSNSDQFPFSQAQLQRLYKVFYFEPTRRTSAFGKYFFEGKYTLSVFSWSEDELKAHQSKVNYKLVKSVKKKPYATICP